MNNTRTLATVAIFMAATLVVGVTFAAPTTQSAFASKKDKQDKFMKGEQDSYKKRPPPQQDNNKTRDNGHDDGGGGNGNGNTVTVQVDKQKAYQSGWDNTQEQEAQNTICTHPESDASCVSEGSQTPVNSTSSTDLTDGSNGGGGTGD